MQCTCIEVNCDDPCDTILQEIVKARKPHQCCECNETIQKGEMYEHYAGKYEGAIFHRKTCKDCLSLRDAYFCSYTFGNIWDLFKQEVYECSGNICLEPLEELTPKARTEACKIIDEYWRDNVD